MGKQYVVKITDFSGGLSEDKRVQVANKFSITKHFDALTYPHKLVPYNKTQAIDNETKSQNLQKFVYTQGKFYALGDQSGGGNSTKVQVYENSGLGGTDSFSASVNGAGSTTNKNTDVFFAYKTFIYMLVGGNKLSQFDTAGGAYTDAYQSVSYTTTQTQAQPVWHPSDDIAYFFCDGNVHSLNNTSWSPSVLILPSNQRIVSACPYGNYLALGCVTTDTYNKRSIVYLWDRDSSLTTLSERIDFDEGQLIHLATLDNKLTALVMLYANDTLSLKKGKFLIRQASGTSSVVVNTILTDQNVVTPTATKFIRDNKMYFPLEADYNGDNRFGIWVVDGNGNATLDTIEEEEITTKSIQGIYLTGNIWWIAHGADGSVNRSSYTNADYSSTNASVYESLIFTGGDSSQTKSLIGVTATYEPLLLAGAIVKLEYRKNEETSWTTVFSHTNDVGSVSHDAVNIESTGNILPQWNEIQFRISSLNGSVITGLRFAYEVKENAPYQP